MYHDTVPLTLMDQVFGVPSAKLYNQFLTQIIKRKIPFPTVFSIRPHNHYLQVLRECIDHSECMQSLYVACTKICVEHNPYPITHNQLTKILSGLL